MRCFVMFVTAVCVLFLLKLKWPKNKSFYDVINFEENVAFISNDLKLILGLILSFIQSATLTSKIFLRCL